MTQSNRLTVLACEIRQAHADAQEAATTAIQRAIDAGHALVEAKSLVKHGEWLPWMKEQGLSVRMSQHYMRLARKYPDPKCETVSHLNVANAIHAASEPRLRCFLCETVSGTDDHLCITEDDAPRGQAVLEKLIERTLVGIEAAPLG